MSANDTWISANNSSGGPKYGPISISAVQGVCTWRAIIVIFFMVGLVVPFIFFLGPLRLSVYRLILIVLFLPALFSWLSGGAGEKRLIDFLIYAHALWAAAALLVHHGWGGGGEFAGMWIVETVGPFLIARWCIRSEVDFRLFARVWLCCIAVLVPFAVVETLTSHPVLLSILGKIAPVPPNAVMEQRWGLDRAQASFEHPILFGTFCAGAFGVSYYLARGPHLRRQRLIRCLPTAAATFCSLSVGAWVGFYLQGALMLWELITRRLARRWTILGALFLLAYIVVDILSNRSPFHVFVDYMTFNQGNSYNRILIWNFGTASVWKHPIMGVGLMGWERPWWMHASMDNFWLVFAVRYGLPAFAAFAGAVILLCWQLGRRELPQSIAACRMGLLVTIGGLSIAGATVHYWNATYCLFTFLLGSGMWMLDTKPAQAALAEAHPDKAATVSRDLLSIRYRGAPPVGRSL